MKNRLLMMSIVLAFMAAPSVVCAQGTDPGVGKVGVVNMQAAIANTQEGKKALADLQKKYQPRKQDLDRQSQEIAALQDQLQRQQTTLSDDQQRQLSRQIDEKQKIFTRARDDAQSDFQQDNQEIFTRIGQKMVRLLNEYAQQNGFTLIVEGANSQMPVYFVAPQVELTEEMIKRYDAANPVAGAETSATPAAKSPAATKGPAAAKPAEKPKP